MGAGIRRLAGQLVIVGFDAPCVSADLRAFVREFDPGGVILFARNVESPVQVADLTREIQSGAREWPRWITVDQEGGRVARLRAPFTEWPPMASLGRSGDVALARRFARALASELRAVGINLDWAPVLDVHTNPANPVIGDRALSDRADDVARLGAAIIQGMHDEGVAACGKHFPGHGDTHVDSHEALPVVRHDGDRLRAVEMAPFRSAIAAGVGFVMTAHVLVPALDGERPATLSRSIVTGLLRDELKFDGVIVSDDLEMRAISASWDLPAASVAAIGAGCDAVLLCGANHDRQAAVVEAVIRGCEDGTLPVTRVEDALARLRRAKARFLSARAVPRRPDAGGAAVFEAHRRIAEEMARFL